MTLEVCAGLVDKTGKSFKEHVVAEIEEETGYKEAQPSFLRVIIFILGRARSSGINKVLH